MNKRYYLIGFLCLLTILSLTNFEEVGIIGLTGFFLAYLTKGYRNIKNKSLD